MEHLKYLNKFFVRYKWHLGLGIIFVTLSNFFRVLQPKMIREGFDLVVEHIGIYGLLNDFDLRQDYYAVLSRTLLYYGGMVLLLALLMGVFMYFMRQTIIVMSRLIEYDLRKEIFAKYESLTTAFYKRNNTGDLMSRITEDVSKVRMYIGPAVLYCINMISLTVLVIYSMLSVSPKLTMYVLLPLPFLSLSIYYVSNLINKRSYIIQQQLATLNSTAQEIYSGIRVVKSYVQEKATLQHFTHQAEEYKEKSLKLATVDAYFFPLMTVMIGASTILTVFIGGLQVVRGEISPGNIAEFVIYVNMLTWPVTAIGWIASIYQQAAASQQRINQFLQQEPEIQNPVPAEARRAKPIKGDVVFKDVSFVYPDTGIRALHQLNFELRAGQKMAIIGKTGSGKTTIADLLLRMYDVTEGQILIDQQDVRTHDLGNLRERIGYVPQDVFLFSNTIAENIAFGRADASRELIEEMAKNAAVYDDIMGLSDGFDTMVGERGVTLSGGQKQRLSIARALLKEPDLIILDDCLSAVDTNTEKQVLSYFSDTLADKTAIIITHRIYSLLQFDKIIVLDDGRIVEQGTHAELLANGGYYADLFEQQSLEEGVQ